MPGLVRKYLVTKLVDPKHKHDNCEYFVLDPQHDPLAREALATYMGAALREGKRSLAVDLSLLLERTK